MLQACDWYLIVGLGSLWLGAQITWVAPRPRQLRSGTVPTAPKGSAQAFMLFWLDQYGWLGLTLSTLGILSAGYGALCR